VADWRDAPPGPLTPRWSGPGLTRRRCAGAGDGEPGHPRLLPSAHAARVSAAPQAVGGSRVALEDMLPMGPAERLQTLGLARSPRNPQDCRPSVGSRCPGTGGKTPVFSPRSSLTAPPAGVSPSTATRQQRRRNASQCSSLPRAADEPMGALGSSNGHGHERSECACCQARARCCRTVAPAINMPVDCRLAAGWPSS